MNMRSQFTKTVESLMDANNKVVTLLGDIGVFGFRNLKSKYPDRVYNIGILEQATISLAAGMAATGIIPIVHTIAPFLVERAYEQLKIDFGYQKINGNFVSVGASIDYTGLGSTHHCPADVDILMQIPGMQILLPGTAEEFDTLLSECFDNGSPTYYRISESCNKNSQEIKFGKANIVQRGSDATVVVVGPLLEKVMETVKDKNVTVIYYTTLYPFDNDTLKENCPSRKILICEPYYSGALLPQVISTFQGEKIQISNFGIPHNFITSYGSFTDIENDIGLTKETIDMKLKDLING